MIKKIGQVWIETVLYTIVGLAIIGIVLGFAMPKINQAKDNALIEPVSYTHLTLPTIYSV